ncbi:hypothetical protein [Actinokineospora sp.]
MRDLRVTCQDGRVIFLHTVRSSPPGGDDFAASEPIVTKAGAATARDL